MDQQRLPTEIIFQIILSIPSPFWKATKTQETADFLRLRLICKSIDLLVTKQTFHVMKKRDDHFLSRINDFQRVPAWYISHTIQENIKIDGADVHAMDDATSAAYHAVQSANFIPRLGCEMEGWSEEVLWRLVGEIFRAWGPVIRVPLRVDEPCRVSINNISYGELDPFYYIFLLAACRGKNEILRKLLESQKDLNINFLHPALGNAFFLACSNGHTSTVQLLLEHGFDINRDDAYLSRALQCVIHGGHLELLQLIAPKMEKKEPCGCGQPLLFCAVDQSDKGMLQVLLDNLQDVNDACQYKELMRTLTLTPLEYAIYSNRPEDVVKVFLESDKVNPNAGTLSPLGRALLGKRLSVAELLLQHPRIRVQHDIINASQPLGFAVTSGSLEAVELLLRYVTFETKDIEAAIEACCLSPGDAAYIVKLLFERYPAVRPSFKAFMSGRWIVSAILGRNVDIARFLIEHGANINCGELYQDSNPFTIAISRQYLNIAEALLQRDDIDVNIASSTRTPLIAAVEAGNYRIAKALLQRPEIKVNLPCGLGSTPLLRAAGIDIPSIIRLLLNHPDIDVNRCGAPNLTPLQTAVNKNQADNVRLLLEHGARFDVSAHNWEGIMEFVKENEWTEMSTLIVEECKKRDMLGVLNMD